MQSTMRRIIFALFVTITFSFVVPVHASDHYSQGTVVDIQSVAGPQGKPVDRFVIRLDEGGEKGKNVGVIIDSSQESVIGSLAKGDRVIVEASQAPGKKPVYLVSTRVRTPALLILTLLFVACTLLVARVRGFASIGAMVLSFAVIFFFILPRIIAGDDPVLTAILGSCVFVPVSFVLSHGANPKTVTAVVSTLVALIITGLLGTFFVELGNLTGFASEEASYVLLMVNQSINLHDLLLAGIVIGASGILDDITVSQSAVVFALKSAAPDMSFTEIYAKAMDVGRDHIASLVNTLILIYAGASLPLLLLFISSSVSPLVAVNFEVIAEEIVRTLVASIGIILAVPITTLFATIVVTRSKKRLYHS